jgi:hypothetical protein
LKKYLIPIFCLLHMAAIFWWTLPHSFGPMVLSSSGKNTVEAKLLNGLMLDDYPHVAVLLNGYIDVTGSQQYWDFFAPHSPRFHQYLSVCNAITAYPKQEKISCKGKPLFSNLDENSLLFNRFDSDRSRLYRLTENLVTLGEPLLLKRFTQYYQSHYREKDAVNTSAQLVLHQFELHPGLKGLPKAGYRMDKTLLFMP